MSGYMACAATERKRQSARPRTGPDDRDREKLRPNDAEAGAAIEN